MGNTEIGIGWTVPTVFKSLDINCHGVRLETSAFTACNSLNIFSLFMRFPPPILSSLDATVLSCNVVIPAFSEKQAVSSTIGPNKHRLKLFICNKCTHIKIAK